MPLRRRTTAYGSCSLKVRRPAPIPGAWPAELAKEAAVGTDDSCSSEEGARLGDGEKKVLLDLSVLRYRREDERPVDLIGIFVQVCGQCWGARLSFIGRTLIIPRCAVQLLEFCT